VVKLYPSLDDLSVWYEVREGDILHVTDAPTAPNQARDGASNVWVRPDAQVVQCAVARAPTEARFLAGNIAARLAGGPAAALAAPAQGIGAAGGAGGGQIGSVWPCSVIEGYCLASNDMPCAYTQQYWCPGQVLSAASCFTCAGYTCVAVCYSAGCPPSVRFCPSDNPRITRCCAVASAVCPVG
jgi:hypothetical protein